MITSRDRAVSILEAIIGAMIISRLDLRECMRGSVDTREQVIRIIEKHLILYAQELNQEKSGDTRSKDANWMFDEAE